MLHNKSFYSSINGKIFREGGIYKSKHYPGQIYVYQKGRVKIIINIYHCRLFETSMMIMRKAWFFKPFILIVNKKSLKLCLLVSKTSV